MGYHDILCKKRHSQKGVAYWELLDTFLTNPAAPPQSYNHSAVGAQSITLPEFISDLSYSPLYTCIWAIRGVLREEGSNLQGFELSLNHVIYSFYKRGHVFPKNNVNFCPPFIETFCMFFCYLFMPRWCRSKTVCKPKLYDYGKLPQGMNQIMHFSLNLGRCGF